MARLMSAVVGLLVMVSASATSADDKIVGAVWEIKFEAKVPGKELLVRFRATPDGKVYDRGSVEIGSWKGDQEKAEMKITGLIGNLDRANGTYVLTNISKGKVPRWSGKWTSPDDKISRSVAVKLLKD